MLDCAILTLPGLRQNPHRPSVRRITQLGAFIYKHACAIGCEGIVSKRLGTPYRSGRVDHWLKVKNPVAPAVKREAEEDWGSKRWARGRRTG